jgi:hypothetical protein
VKRRYGLIALMATVGLVVAAPAFGGPSAFDLALRAFKQSEEATAKAKRASHRARAARRRANLARRKIERTGRRAVITGRSLRKRIEVLETAAVLGSAADAITGRSAFSSEICKNDETDPWEEDEFLQCGDAVTLDLGREYRVLVNVSVSWFGNYKGAIGECTVLDRGQPSGPVVSSGERTTTTDKNATNGASFSAVLVPRTGQSVLAVGCRERMLNMDWTDISISAVAIGAG